MFTKRASLSTGTFARLIKSNTYFFKSNGHFMDKYKSKVYLKNTRRYGRGVFALRKIRKGEVVGEFDGPIYDEYFEPWTRELQTHVIQFAKEKWRDSSGLARYMNHSCEPNCGIRGLFKVVAMRTIQKDEQITWDYEMTEKSDWWRMKCRCGTESCRKIIGTFKALPTRIRRKYRGYISTWLVKA